MNNEYPISKDWDCKYTLEELIEDNTFRCDYDDKLYCKFVANYRKHTSDNCYGDFILLFKFKNDDYIQVGVNKEGFVYIGEQNYIDKKNTICLNVYDALDFMMKYRNFMNSIGELETKMINLFHENCINIIYSHNYQKQYKYGEELIFRNKC